MQANRWRFRLPCGCGSDNNDKGVGATDNAVGEDGDGNGATDDDSDGNGAADDNDGDDADGNDDSNGAAENENDVNDDANDKDDNNLPPRIGKRNDGCDETKTEEEEAVAYSVEIHTTIKQITGRGVVDGDDYDDYDDNDEGSCHDINDDNGRQQRLRIRWVRWPPPDEEGEMT